MSRSPPRSWYSRPELDRKPPPDWPGWQDYKKGRTPPRTYFPQRGSPPRDPRIRHNESNVTRYSSMTKTDRPPSPMIQVSHSRPLNPSWQERSLNPSMKPPPSPRGERLPGPGADWPQSFPQSAFRSQSPPRRPLDPYRRSPSPRRGRFPSPPRDLRSYEWHSRSPPRQLGPPPPREWTRRSRSPPPHWVRRSPPPHEHSRRSPPRDHWRPPASELDRYHGPPPFSRYSPTRREPSSSESYDRRWPDEPVPSSRRGLPYDAQPVSQRVADSTSKFPYSSSGADSRQRYQENDDSSSEEEYKKDIRDLPDYDPEVAAGQQYVMPVSGFFCKVCHKFYNSEQSAKVNHCKSKSHYDKFSKWLSEVQVAELVRRRMETCNGAEKVESDRPTEPKQLKLDHQYRLDSAKTSKQDSTAIQYSSLLNLSERVAKFMEKEKKKKQEYDKGFPVNKMAEMKYSIPFDTNGLGQTGENSDDEVLITNNTKEDDEDIVDATLYNIRKLKINELKANLERRGMKSTGLKSLLLKRLEKVLMDEAGALPITSEVEGRRRPREDR